MHTEIRSGSEGEIDERGIPVANQTFGPALLDPTQEIPSGIIGPDGNTPPKRFAVYRNNVVVSLMDALGEAYPSTKAILGEEDFQKIARIYVSKHPPKSAMMQAFGQEFAEFLAEFKPLEKSGFFPDLARLERFWLEAHHAVDEETLAPDILGQIPPEQLLEIKFETHPAAFVLSSDFPIVDLFHRRHDTSFDIDLTKAQTALITRPYLDVLAQEVEVGQATFFGQLAAGENLGNATEAATAADPDFELAIAIGLMLESGFCKNIKPLNA